ncbi:MAG: hypothetical protein PHY29_01340 [Syntrophales bacterium]|nr:hypothetical protein [Syntrophales bacterium]
MQSLSRREDLPELLDGYGQVIVDECHHISAFSFEAILKHAIPDSLPYSGLPRITADIPQKNRQEVLQTLGMFDCKIISMRNNYCIIQVAGSREDVETVINFLRPLGMDKVARTGVLALQQTEKVSIYGESGVRFQVIGCLFATKCGIRASL